jgi:hypothetical protein
MRNGFMDITQRLLSISTYLSIGLDRIFTQKLPVFGLGVSQRLIRILAHYA